MSKVLNGLTEEDFMLIESDQDAFWKKYKYAKSLAPLVFFNSKISSIKIPSNIKDVMSSAFLNCKNLTHVSFEKSIEMLNERAFYGCSNLQTVENLAVDVVGNSAFEMCSKLRKIDLSKRCKKIGNKSFAKCENLIEVLMPKVQILDDYCFCDCFSLKRVNFPNTLKSINYHSFFNCYNLEEAILPEGLESLWSGAFENCVALNKVFLPKSLSFCGDDAFKGCSRLRYVQVFEDQSMIFYESPFQAEKKYKEIFDLSDCFVSIKDFLINRSFFITNFNQPEPMIKDFVRIAQNARKHGIVLTQDFVKKLVAADQAKVFSTQNFGKHFRKIQNKYMESMSINNWTGLLIFAYDIGCFSENQRLSQRANEWLSERLMKNDLQINSLSYFFRSWEAEGENEEFSNFLFSRDQNTNIPIFDQILAEPNFHEFMLKIYDEFRDPDAEVKKGGRFRNSEGKLRFANLSKKITKEGSEVFVRKDFIPTVDLFKSYFLACPYRGIVTAQDFAIAREFSKWGKIPQKDFNEAKRIMREFNTALEAGVLTTSIVGTHLTNFEERVRRYDEESKRLAEEGIAAARGVATQLNNSVVQEFFYDWLEKDSEENFTLALNCRCCSHLSGAGFGIMLASFLHPDVQNLAIKMVGGEPVAKATAYVNRKQGYVVFNTIQARFDLTEKQLDEVFEQFLLAADVFAKEYNKIFPKKTIKVMTVGMHLNSLETQIRRSKKPAPTLTCLNYGAFGKFMQDYPGDWQQEGQYKVWDIEDCGEVKHEK